MMFFKSYSFCMITLSCFSDHMMGVYVTENDERWVLPLPDSVWNIKTPVTQAPQASMALAPICFWYFKPNPAVEALISQQFLLYSPSFYGMRSMKTAETKNFGKSCLPSVQVWNLEVLPRVREVFKMKKESAEQYY